jgi:hypothetical protein
MSERMYLISTVVGKGVYLASRFDREWTVNSGIEEAIKNLLELEANRPVYSTYSEAIKNLDQFEISFDDSRLVECTDPDRISRWNDSKNLRTFLPKS